MKDTLCGGNRSAVERGSKKRGGIVLLTDKTRGQHILYIKTGAVDVDGNLN